MEPLCLEHEVALEVIMWMMTCPRCRRVVGKIRPDEPWHCWWCHWPRA